MTNKGRILLNPMLGFFRPLFDYSWFLCSVITVCNLEETMLCNVINLFSREITHLTSFRAQNLAKINMLYPKNLDSYKFAIS